MTTIRILSCAEAELAEAIDYYNGECAGLGYALAAEVKTPLNRIRAFPEAWPRLSARARRGLVGRFPYGILYQVRGDEILVLAIMHLRRAPVRWAERLAEAAAEDEESRPQR
jgi:hypothetical protein